jgi:endonuclease YncB( thermonuclease family)
MARGIWTTAILLITTVAALPAPAAVEIAGVASIIDGDTIKIHGQHIRLFGIDSPESTQFCEKEGIRTRF